MKVFAFIFARGGSKGLPGKNILPLGGIPLIGHSILLAKDMCEISKVIVSTDCDQIASVAREYGAEVITRPAELAEDNSPEWAAWVHAINYLTEQGEEFDTFLSLPATSPLRAKEDVTDCLKALDDATDVVITVTPASRSPYFNMVSREPDGSCEILVKSRQDFCRRQDAPEVFDITTVAYAIKKDYVLHHSSLFEGKVRSIVVPKGRAVDIDDEMDFSFAQYLYGRVHNAT